jgi:glutamate formiminotransferase
MHVVFARVGDAARQLGTQVIESEIVGLVPGEALDAARAEAPDLWRWHAHQVLEARLEAHGL